AVLGISGQKDGLSLENSKWLVDTSLQKISYSMTFADWGVNLGFMRLADDSGFNWTSATGTSNGTAYYSENMAMLALGREAFGLYWGAVYKNFSKTAVDEKSFGNADIGILYDSRSFWKFGAKCNNILAASEKNDKTVYYEIGMEFRLSQLFTQIEMLGNLNKYRFSAGYQNDWLLLNSGLDEDNNFSAGIRLNIWSLILEYAFKNMDIGNVSRFGLVLQL
ncbi:MAG: hypothetical protein PHV30_09335, partial [Candidatus Margulisbacteria bacterium]|nr:hypothetical protein [Candidatus Margulisiibacteriota bacterium]